jgi:photosystem II stability/assembly factor-like uncharacterized protein
MFSKISFYGLVFGILFAILAGCNETNTQKSAPPVLHDQSSNISTTSNPTSVDAESSNVNNPIPSEIEPPPKHSDLKGQPEESTGEDDPLRLTDMNFINGKVGWTTASTTKGSIMWKTSDEGKSWAKVSTPDLYIGKMGFISANEGWIIGKSDCREEKGDVLCTKVQIEHTVDGGAHWEVQWSVKVDNANLYQQPDNLFVVDSNRIYVVVDNENMLMTTDGGKKWNTINFGLGRFLPDAASFDADGKHGWVLGSAGKGCTIIRSTVENCVITELGTSDGGLHWKYQWSKGNSNNLRNVGISFSNLNYGKMLIFNMDNLQSTLYSTSDGGKTWSKTTEMRGGRPYTVELQFVMKSIGFIPLSTGAGPIGGGLLMTKDGGKSFENIAPANQEFSFEQVHFFNDKEGWVRMFNFAENDYLMYTNDAGQHWKRIEISPA